MTDHLLCTTDGPPGVPPPPQNSRTSTVEDEQTEQCVLQSCSQAEQLLRTMSVLVPAPHPFAPTPSRLQVEQLLRTMSRLTSLDLGQNQLGPVVGKAVAVALAACSQLEVLDLSWNPLGSSVQYIGWALIAPRFKGCYKCVRVHACGIDLYACTHACMHTCVCAPWGKVGFGVPSEAHAGRHRWEACSHASRLISGSTPSHAHACCVSAASP